MYTFRFSTSVRCGGCIEKIRPLLDGEPSVQSWTVDTSDPSRILTVQTSAEDPLLIVRLLEKAGYQATLLAA